MRLRTRLLLMSILASGTSLVTVLAVALLLGPTLHDRLMTAMGVPLHDDLGEMSVMARATEQAFTGALLQALLVAALVALLLAVAVSLATSRQLAAPITTLLTASRRIAAGNYAQRVPEIGDVELRALASQFNAMATELQSTEQRRQTLIADVAHELRTPLATIQGYAEGLLDGVVPAEPATWALLRDETTRLQRLASDLDDLAQADAQQLQLRRALIAPGALVQRAVVILAPHYAVHGVTLNVDAGANLPPVLVDADRIVQVLINLLGNALRATPAAGSVTVTCTAAADLIGFVVRDTGIGIAPAHLAHVFDRFYRIDPARSRSTGGSGVGLTIARAIAAAHGGTLTLTSTGPGTGATATLTLPQTTAPIAVSARA